MKASILAVGTELTSGQIINSNAALISKRLKAEGIVTVIHLTVPDDRTLIEQSLKQCAGISELMFVTGGLGPTSDDFTRDLITEWAGQPLEFDEASWKKVQDRLSSRGIPVHDFQKQQCFFPKSAQILNNAQGTANAFYLEQPTHLWALPGPPNEIEAVWTDHIQPRLKVLTKDLDPHVTHSWDTLGLGENQVAKIVEPLVQGSGLEIGYRVHLPYVETKLSYFHSNKNQMLPYVHKVEVALAPYAVARDGEDVAQMFCEKVQNMSHLCIQDNATDGFLLKRLHPFLKTLLKNQALTYTQQPAPVDMKGLVLTCQLNGEASCQMKLIQNQQVIYEALIEAPFKSPLMLERRKQYFSERVLIEAVTHCTI